MANGKLVWNYAGEQLTVQWMSSSPTNPKPREWVVNPGSIADDHLLAAFYAGAHQLDGTDVEFKPVTEGNALAGVTGITPILTEAEKSERQLASQARDVYVPGRAGANHGLTSTHAGERFANPYGFVPAPPRRQQGLLADAPPASHASFAEEAVSGVISVELTVKTDLLLRELSRVEENGHKVHEVPRSASGAPHLSGTAIKGMLRSAFEAITNSRFPRVDDRQLTYRLLRTETQNLVPVRITATKDGGWCVTECTRLRLPRYGYEHTEVDGRDPEHGEAVKFTRLAGRGRAPALATQLQPVSSEPAGNDQGWVVITGTPVGPDNKKHESVFVPTSTQYPVSVGQAEVLAQSWRATVQATQDAAVRNDAIRVEGGWFRDNRDKADFRSVLQATGQVLCWAKFNGNNDIEALVPNQHGRAAYVHTPLEVLPASVRPATRLDDLSPADRVFGWTHGAVAHAGQLRVASVRLLSDQNQAIRNGPRTLPILASPKPDQVLFYAARDQFGTPWPDGNIGQARAGAYRRTSEETGDVPGLRGRKVYPRRSAPIVDSGRGDQRSNLNSTVKNWVAPESRFRFDLHVINLNRAEAGALLWLLSHGNDRRLRLGGGRPAGYGEVHLKAARVELETGAAIRQRLTTLTPPDASLTLGNEKLISAFREAVWEESYEPRTTVAQYPDHVRQFEAAMTGPGDRIPTHYPRVTPGGDIRDWFTANSQRAMESLPMLAPDMPTD